MVDNKSLERDAAFHVLSDRTRRAMVASLLRGQWKVSEPAPPFATTLAAASRHTSGEGRMHICRLDGWPTHGGFEWMHHYERYWRARLDALEALLEAEDAAAKANKSGKPTRKSPANSNRKRKPK
jgi:hypothetical protein